LIWFDRFIEILAGFYRWLNLDTGCLSRRDVRRAIGASPEKYLGGRYRLYALPARCPWYLSHIDAPKGTPHFQLVK
jgi:hypothetical protein